MEAVKRESAFLQFALEAERVLTVATRLTVYAGVVVLAAITCVTTYSALRRYLIGSPLAAGDELARFLFVGVSFLPLAHVLLLDRHVRLELLWRHLPVRVGRYALCLGDLITAAALFVTAWVTFGFAQFSIQIGATSDAARIPLGPIMMLVPAGLVLVGLAAVARCFRRLAALAAGVSDESLQIKNVEAELSL
jgi:TRAP-type C4-dicarboxylate transport system permease small subunit